MKNYYEILEINTNASKEIIEKAYKVLAKKYHPDTQPEEKKSWAESKFKEINEAYEVLSNNSKKSDYDKQFVNSENDELEVLYNKNIELQKLVNELKSTPNVSSTTANTSNTQNTYNNNNNFPNNAFDNFTSAYQPQKKVVNYYKYYRSNTKSRLKDFLAFLITILLIILIGFIIWKIPYTKNLLITIYEENAPIKTITDIILKLLPL